MGIADGEGFFGGDMFAGKCGSDPGRGVPMIRRRNHHSINILIGNHFTIIAITFDSVIFKTFLSSITIVDHFLGVLYPPCIDIVDCNNLTIRQF